MTQSYTLMTFAMFSFVYLVIINQADFCRGNTFLVSYSNLHCFLMPMIAYTCHLNEISHSLFATSSFNVKVIDV